MKKFFIIQFVENTDATEALIKSLGSHYKLFENQWIVVSDSTAKLIYEKISAVTVNKSALVLKVDPVEYWGRMDTKFWDWLNEEKNQVKL